MKKLNIKNIKINGRKINSNMVIGASILLVLLVVVLVSLFYTPFDPEGMELTGLLLLVETVPTEEHRLLPLLELIL